MRIKTMPDTEEGVVLLSSEEQEELWCKMCGGTDTHLVYSDRREEWRLCCRQFLLLMGVDDR